MRHPLILQVLPSCSNAGLSYTTMNRSMLNCRCLLCGVSEFNFNTVSLRYWLINLTCLEMLQVKSQSPNEYLWTAGEGIFFLDGFPDAQPTASEYRGRNCYFISSFLVICFLLHIVIYEGGWWFSLVGVSGLTLSVGWREGRVVRKKASATCPLRFSSTTDGERRLLGNWVARLHVDSGR